MTSDNNQQKKCGFCGESIPVGAGRCPYCGSILEVTFDNSYKIDPSEEKPVIGETAGQANTEQQVGHDADMVPTVSEKRNYPPNYNYSSGMKEPLSNGMKVFLTVLFTVLPGVGQLAGIIAAIVFMNSDGDSDRKSFGVALLVASLVMFVISCIGCFILVIALSANQTNFNY